MQGSEPSPPFPPSPSPSPSPSKGRRIFAFDSRKTSQKRELRFLGPTYDRTCLLKTEQPQLLRFRFLMLGFWDACSSCCTSCETLRCNSIRCAPLSSICRKRQNGNKTELPLCFRIGYKFVPLSLSVGKLLQPGSASRY